MAQSAEQKKKERSIRTKFRFNEKGIDLVDKLLTLDPSRRLSAAKALDHPYFWQDAPVAKPSELPRFGITSCHEFEVKKIKEEDRAKRKEAEEAQAQARPAVKRPTEPGTKPSHQW